MKYLVLLAAFTLTGCANMNPNSVKDSPVVYEVRTQGNHADLAGCIAGRLQGHDKYLVRAQEYAVRNYDGRSEIQAYQDSMYGGKVYLFTVDLQQKDSSTIRVSLKRIAEFKQYVEEALQSCSSGA